MTSDEKWTALEWLQDESECEPKAELSRAWIEELAAALREAKRLAMHIGDGANQHSGHAAVVYDQANAALGPLTEETDRE